MTLLENGGFEQDWGDEQSHSALVIPASGIPEIREVGNIFSSPAWLTWFRHIPGTFDQPEVRDAWKATDARRVRSGEKGMLFFTFSRAHWGGFLQQVSVERGKRYKATAWAHAWSNHNGAGFPHPHDGRWSEGAGDDEVAWPEGSQPHDTGDPQQDAKANFTFRVGIDPTGGANPMADTVVWGDGFHIYNGYVQQLSAEAVAQSDTITVFLSSKTLWAFCHSDAYWDDAELVQVGDDPAPDPDPPLRGQPRVDYERTYLLLPPAAGEAWAAAAVDATWDAKRLTIGGSADDSGVGNLSSRTVIAVNPTGWPGDLRAFFDEHYPGVVYVPIHAETPADLYRQLVNDEPNEPIPPFSRALLVGLHDESGGIWMKDDNIEGLCLAHRCVSDNKINIDFSTLADAGIKIICRLNYGYADGTGTVPPPDKADTWVQAIAETIRQGRGVWGWVIANEQNNPSEWPGGYPHPAYAISPEYYVSLYNYIWDCTRAQDLLAPAALDPYNVVAREFGLPGDPRDWANYIYAHVRGIDFVALHAKTQTNDPAECQSNAKFDDPPLTGRFLHLRTIEDQITWIPDKYRNLPIYLTEVNPQFIVQGVEIGWTPNNSEWVREACAYLRTRNIAGAAFYRYEMAGDQAAFGLCDKQTILAAIKAEVTKV